MPGKAKQGGGRCTTTARCYWPWLVLLVILAGFAGAIIWIGPAANFGSLQDDAFYFAAAKAIAAGKGYMLPSFPGGLTTLKSPELYPWLLSWVWRWVPTFPANVAPAIGLTLAFGLWFLVACFLVAKNTLRLEPVWALVVATLCGFNFFALVLGASVLTDLPFAALALTAALCADRALERDGHWAWMGAAGLLAGLATGLRTVGVTVVAGIVLVALVRRRYRMAVLMCAVGGGLALPWILPSLLRALAALRVSSIHRSSPELPLGWRQTLALYSSYIDLWRNSVPNWATQWTVLWKNILSAIVEPGVFLLFPVANRSVFLNVGLGGLVTLGSWGGILYRFRKAGWKAIHGISLLYLAMVLPYPFPPQRFLVLLLPLFFGGLAVVIREVVSRAVVGLRSVGATVSRAGAAASLLALVAFAGIATANCLWFAPRELATLMNRQRVLLAEERQAYRWIERYTAPQATFIAYNDVLLYLYTGRQAIRPIDCSTAGYYDNDPSVPLRDADHITDVARFVDATYWVTSPGDFGAEVGADRPVLLQRENEILASLPLVFRSSDGHVRIYDIRSLTAADRQR